MTDVTINLNIATDEYQANDDDITINLNINNSCSDNDYVDDDDDVVVPDGWKLVRDERWGVPEWNGVGDC